MASSVHPSLDTDFTLRRADSREDLAWIMHEVEKGRRPVCHLSAEIFHASGQTGSFFIGEKGGVRISSVGFFKLDSSYMAVSYYFVVEAERGKGYGRRTWEYGWEASKASEYCMILRTHHGGIGEGIYLKTGYSSVWEIGMYVAPVQELKSTLSRLPVPEDITVQPGSTTDFTALAAFDHSVRGANRQALLESLIKVAPISFVATNRQCQVVGFVAIVKIQLAEVQGDTYFAIPFLAESTSVAASLLKSAVPALANLENENVNLWFNVPNLDCEEVVGFLNDTMKTKQSPFQGACFMCNGDPPKIAHNKFYSDQFFIFF